MRGCSWGPIRPLTAPGSRKRPLIPEDDALSAGGFQVAAQLRRLLLGAKRPDHRAVNDALFAEIRPSDRSRTCPQHGWILTLQSPVGSQRIGLVLLRGDL